MIKFPATVKEKSVLGYPETLIYLGVEILIRIPLGLDKSGLGRENF